MSDYGIPLDSTEDLDRAYTEETVRRLAVLAEAIIEGDLTGAQELFSRIWTLGIHLDHMYGLNITGGDA